MGRVYRYIECNDIILLAVLLELGGVVAFVTVENQQPVRALCSRRCMVIEMLDPI